MEASFSILESTLTVPCHSVADFKLCAVFFKINIKNVISRKLKGFEQTYLEARFVALKVF